MLALGLPGIIVGIYFSTIPDVEVGTVNPTTIFLTPFFIKNTSHVFDFYHVENSCLIGASIFPDQHLYLMHTIYPRSVYNLPAGTQSIYLCVPLDIMKQQHQNPVITLVWIVIKYRVDFYLFHVSRKFVSGPYIKYPDFMFPGWLKGLPNQ